MASAPQAVHSSRKLAALDGVRGLAIIAVFLSHSGWRMARGSILEEPVRWITGQGWMGVDLFFVLSGFLITGILLDSRGAENYFRSFYARRALRIFPLYYAFLLVGFALFPLTVADDWQPLRADRWLYFCYLTNWLGLWKGFWRANIMGHLWSLAVEEQFYFTWPLLVRVLKPRTLLRAVLTTEAAVIAGRTSWVLLRHPGQTASLATLTRMDGLLLGAGIAVLVRHYRLPERLIAWLPAALVAGIGIYLALVLRYPHWAEVVQLVGFPLLAFSFALLVLFAAATENVRGIMQRTLTGRALGRVGKYAYGIYIFHVPILYFGNTILDTYFAERVNGSGWLSCLSVVLLWLISYYTARLSYDRFERFFLGYKDRFAARFALREAAAPACGQPRVIMRTSE